jgi:hypothetical protein
MYSEAQLMFVALLFFESISWLITWKLVLNGTLHALALAFKWQHILALPMLPYF